MASIQLGDYFVNFNGIRNPFIGLNDIERKIYKEEKCRRKESNLQINGQRKESILEYIMNRREKTFMDELVPQIYSEELAHVTTLIIAKYNEDHGYIHTEYAISDTNNKYVIKMEWEIYMLLNYHVKIHNFITVISNLIPEIFDKTSPMDNNIPYHFGSIFKDLCMQICIDRNLLCKDPRILVIATIILYRRGRLKAIKINKKRIFCEIMYEVAREYELNIIDVVREYTKIKSSPKPIILPYNNTNDEIIQT
jgi:hypothetical protein